MANRVALDDQGLRISKPGIDVLTASDQQLLFTSKYSCFGVAERGDHAVVWNATGNSGSYNQFVGFQSPFASIPIMKFDLVQGASIRTMDLGRQVYMSRNVRQVISGGYGSLAYYDFWTEVSTTGIRFRGTYTRNSGAYVIPNFTVRWTAFSYNV